jgi:hypothetical protein
MSMTVIKQDHYAPGGREAAMWCEQEDVEIIVVGQHSGVYT